MTPAPEKGQLLGLQAMMVLVVVCTSWGLNQALFKILYRDATPVLSSILRSSLAALAVYIYGRLTGERFRADARTMFHGFVMGFMFGVEFIFLSHGFNLTLASRGSIIFYTQPFFTALLAHFLLPGERLSRVRSLGLILAFLGVALVMSGRQGSGQASLLGDLLCLLGGFTWALMTVYVRLFLVGRATPVQTNFWTLAWSLLALVPGTWLTETPRISFTPSLLLVMAYQGLLVSFVSYIVWNRLLYRYQASILAAFTFLAPLTGVFFAGLILGDPITATLLLGLGLVSVGVWLVNRR